MDFTPPRPARKPVENIVPMINVVFLLLIFFLMTAQIAPPLPFEVTPPASASEAAADGRAELSISAQGVLYFDGVTGDGVWDVLAALPAETAVMIRADSAFRATELAGILTRLSEIGLTSIALITEEAR